MLALALALLPCVPCVLAHGTHDESKDENTLGLRIAAVFIILAAGLIGGLPPLYIQVRGACMRALACGRGHVARVPRSLPRLLALCVAACAASAACKARPSVDVLPAGGEWASVGG